MTGDGVDLLLTRSGSWEMAEASTHLAGDDAPVEFTVPATVAWRHTRVLAGREQPAPAARSALQAAWIGRDIDGVFLQDRQWDDLESSMVG